MIWKELYSNIFSMSSSSKTLSIGYSPCPNDTFIFYAMIHGEIETGNLSFNEVLLDIETLNQKALRCELDITKVSYHAFGHLRKDYCLLRSGGALGKGCGPIVVAKKIHPVKELDGKRIAIPGELTTACLLLRLFNSASGLQPSTLSVMPFNRILEAVRNNEVDAGLIIHESRFTYSQYGLNQIVDLGAWWEDTTGLPIPLGGIIAKRVLGERLIKEIDRILHDSIEFAMNNRYKPLNYVKQHSQELSEEVITQHIDLYVNNYSLDIGEDGERAIGVLIQKAEDAGIIPRIKVPVFYED